MVILFSLRGLNKEKPLILLKPPDEKERYKKQRKGISVENSVEASLKG